PRTWNERASPACTGITDPHSPCETTYSCAASGLITLPCSRAREGIGEDQAIALAHVELDAPAPAIVAVHVPERQPADRHRLAFRRRAGFDLRFDPVLLVRRRQLRHEPCQVTADRRVGWLGADVVAGRRDVQRDAAARDHSID